MGFPYIFRWNRHGRKGQRCAVTARGTRNARRLEFMDGYVMIAPGNSIRKVKPSDMCEAEQTLADTIERDPSFPDHMGLTP